MTRRLSSFCMIFIVLFSCSKDENFLRLTSSEKIQRFIPDYSSSKRFASTTDTITISLKDSLQYFSKNNTDLSAGGSLPDFDKLELQRTMVVIGCDTPYLRFYFDLQTQYNETLPTRAEDQLFITFEDMGGSADALITLNYTDSVVCLSERCAYDDTINILNRSFQNVYFTERDGNSKNFLYINSNNGLAGFRTSDQKTYELIP